MLDQDPSAVYRLAALQSPAGRRLLQRSGRAPDDLSSIVLVEPDRHYIRSEAILRIGARLNVPLPLLATLGFPVPLPLRDAVYDAVANNRCAAGQPTHSLGGPTHAGCGAPAPSPSASSSSEEASGAAAMGMAKVGDGGSWWRRCRQLAAVAGAGM
ncbi:hypothetical protein TSOC_009315 [Tetrabaena socialis]|uniref:Uncharacterized protein n=1 Tax=Tetrabaena socialis TaxID=47790 RepID=A0A2J7ZW60_9CHLO|nr:hypothetical protein TSOC_009315 [Tetrabaena socialis]|eukprot:PNH04488.1 hypothetical protein TSOC_009315 [Tetrabaena socialis]